MKNAEDSRYMATPAASGRFRICRKPPCNRADPIFKKTAPKEPTNAATSTSSIDETGVFNAGCPCPE